MVILQAGTDIVSNSFAQYGFLGVLVVLVFYVIKALQKQNEKRESLFENQFKEVQEENKALNKAFLDHLQATEANLLKIIECNNAVIAENTEIFKEILDVLKDKK